MKELERRALMGDRQAQEECTRQGIVLACPKCFKPVTVRGPEDWQPTFHDPDSGGDPYSFECKCGLAFGTYKYDFKEALSDWNTRPAPPIGRCKDCANWNKEDHAGRKELGNYVCACHEWSDPENGYTRYTSENDFCSYFDEREKEK